VSGMRLFGNFLLLVGATSLLVAALAFAVDRHGQDRILPRPVALEKDAGSPATTPTPQRDALVSGALEATAEPSRTAVPSETSTPVATREPTTTPTPTPTLANPGVPIRMAIPSLGVDSQVKEAGTYWEQGQLVWETLPFVVAHYRATAKAGEVGNAVFSGHVTSHNAGNVFQDLYQIELGDRVRVFTDAAEFVYEVSEVRLVLPTETSVMEPTSDERITLITCAGEWNPSKREYSHRLIVTAKLKR